MVLVSRGFRHKTRRRLSTKLRDKFKTETFMKEFKPGDKVVIRQYALSQSGMPFPRFLGKVGTVEGKRGRAYMIKVRTDSKVRELQVAPEHLALLTGHAAD
jgi:large subunit ribosomal protein L21e